MYGHLWKKLRSTQWRHGDKLTATGDGFVQTKFVDVRPMVLSGSESCAGGEGMFASRGTRISGMRRVARRPSEWSFRGGGQGFRF